MFRISGTILSAFTMFLHAGLGCCWHHQHNCRHPADAVVACNHADDTHDHAGHDGHAHQHPQTSSGDAAVCEHARRLPPCPRHDDGNGPRQPCQEADCSFVVTPVVKIFHERLADSQATTDVISLLDSQTPTLLAHARQFEGFPPDDSPPDRLRLRTQVWLI